jgi:hypothetical protein
MSLDMSFAQSGYSSNFGGPQGNRSDFDHKSGRAPTYSSARTVLNLVRDEIMLEDQEAKPS